VIPAQVTLIGQRLLRRLFQAAIDQVAHPNRGLSST